MLALTVSAPSLHPWGTTVHQGPGRTPSHPGAGLPGGSSSVTKLCPTLVTPCTVACQAPLSVGFSRQEYWSGLPFPSPGDLPYPGIEPGSPTVQADALPSEPRPQFNSWVGKIPWRRECLPTPVFLPRESHGQRSLVGYSARGRKESDTTERLHFTSLRYYMKLCRK